MITEEFHLKEKIYQNSFEKYLHLRKKRHIQKYINGFLNMLSR